MIYGPGAGAATVYIKQLRTPSTTQDTWEFTSVDISESDLAAVYSTGIKNSWSLYTPKGGGYCSSSPSLGRCGIGRRPGGAQSITVTDAAAAFRTEFTGSSIEVPAGSQPTEWRGDVYKWGGGAYALRGPGNVVLTPASVSCKSLNSQITLRGRVGERVKESTTMEIHCDSQATIRLTLQGSGLVEMGGGGVVRLSFQGTGQDVLTVSGTDPLVRIDGELTKSPTTAGTYKGSSVLRLDVL